MIYVDELVAYEQKANSPQAVRWFGEGKESCHMYTDGDFEELHVFAESLGLRRAYFQHTRFPHYDLMPKKRFLAIRRGAKETTRREWIARCHSELKKLSAEIKGKYAHIEIPSADDLALEILTREGIDLPLKENL